MFKLVFLIVVAVIGYIAYTGIDVTEEYDEFSEIRENAFDVIIDPLAKKVLNQASESDLDEIIETVIETYGGEQNG